MEKRRILLFGILLLFFGLGNFSEISAQNSCQSSGSVFIGGAGGILIVGSGEGENVLPQDGDIYFTQDGCTATLHFTFRLGNVGEGFPSYADPLFISININGSNHLFDMTEETFFACSNPNIYYWETDIDYNMGILCAGAHPSLVAYIDFLDSEGAPYPIDENACPGDIFYGFPSTSSCCGGGGSCISQISFMVEEGDPDFCDDCGFNTNPPNRNEIPETERFFNLKAEIQPSLFSENPVLYIEGTPEEAFNFTIFNAQGRSIQTVKGQLSVDGTYRQRIDTGTFLAGIYFGKIIQGQHQKTIRMMKIN